MKIPTILGITIVFSLLLLAIMATLVNRQEQSAPRPLSSPSSIQIANASSTSFTVTWITQTPQTGSLSWGNTQNLGNFQGDDRDLDSPNARQTHFVTVKNLTPQTIYYFKIRSGPFFYPQEPISLKTLPDSIQSSNLSPIIGIVQSSSPSNISDTIITLQLANTNPVSTFPSSSGNFLLPLANLRYSDSLTPVATTSPVKVSLLLTNVLLQSIVQTNLPSAHPLPPITLGQNANFIDSKAPNTTLPEPSSSPLSSPSSKPKR